MVHILDDGSLTALGIVMLLDGLQFGERGGYFVFFFALAALSWGWRVLISNLGVDVDLIEVGNCTTEVNLGGAKLILVGFYGLVLSLNVALLGGLSLTCCNT